MKEEAVTDALLRQFLLGKVDDEERQRIESLFITDSAIKDRVVAAEQALIDEYLDDCLSAENRDAFLLVYGDTAAQRRKLRIAKSIQEWAVNQPANASVTPEPLESPSTRLPAWWPLKTFLVVPIAVAAMVAIVVGVVWVSRRTKERDSHYLAQQQELVKLNTPSNLRDVPPHMSTMTLKPGSMRSVEAESELKRPADSSVAELRLLWLQTEDYPSFQATVRGPGDERSYSIPNLTLAREPGTFIRLRLSAQILKRRGNYQVELTGVSANGVKSPPEIYSFTVSE